MCDNGLLKRSEAGRRGGGVTAEVVTALCHILKANTLILHQVKKKKID